MRMQEAHALRYFFAFSSLQLLRMRICHYIAWRSQRCHRVTHINSTRVIRRCLTPQGWRDMISAADTCMGFLRHAFATANTPQVSCTMPRHMLPGSMATCAGDIATISPMVNTEFLFVMRETFSHQPLVMPKLKGHRHHARTTVSSSSQSHVMPRLSPIADALSPIRQSLMMSKVL